jgi:polysaccharide export outer membrane protein
MKQKLPLTGYFLFSVLVLSSCITSSKTRYLQSEKGAAKSSYTNERINYQVQEGDNLYIKFSSTEPVTEQYLSLEAGRTLSQGIEARFKDVYLVDNKGFVKIPQLDKIKVAGLSLNNIRDSIDLKIQRFYPQTTSQVRLADNFVTIIGDVKQPGRYQLDFSDNIDLFELIGMAGDLTYEANRNSVKLIRKKGIETEIISLDLTKRNILENQYYQILPNDIVYIEPLKAVSWHQRSFPFATSLALLLSTTTTILVIISYFK